MANLLADFIQEQQRRLGLDDKQAAERADIDLDVYLRYKYGDMRKIHTVTLTKIAAALQADASEMLRLAGVRRRRARTHPMEVRASQAHYTVSTDHDEPVTPADFAKAMMLKAAQLEEEAQRKEGEAASILEAARSLRETARDLRAKAQVLLTDTEHAQE